MNLASRHRSAAGIAVLVLALCLSVLPFCLEVGVCLDGCPHDTPRTISVGSGPTAMLSVAFGAVLIVAVASAILGQQRDRLTRAVAVWTPENARPVVVPLRI